MKMHTMIKTGLLVLLIFACGRMSAQSADNIAMEYLRTVGDQTTIYYGSLQLGRPQTVNHPYLVAEQYTAARLSFRGVVYPEVRLRLDLERDKLIILSPNGSNIVLVSKDLDYAVLHGRHIVYLDNDVLPTGHYTVLHSGNTTVLKRQTAILTYRQVPPSGMERRFMFRTTFYLYKDGVYHMVRNQRGLLRILYPHQRALRQFISANNLNYRRHTEELITRTIIEYEKLSK